eukprot:1385565-Prorocentrum_lima.AAC.1
MLRAQFPDSLPGNQTVAAASQSQAVKKRRENNPEPQEHDQGKKGQILQEVLADRETADIQIPPAKQATEESSIAAQQKKEDETSKPDEMEETLAMQANTPEKPVLGDQA